MTKTIFILLTCLISLGTYADESKRDEKLEYSNISWIPEWDKNKQSLQIYVQSLNYLLFADINKAQFLAVLKRVQKYSEHEQQRLINGEDYDPDLLSYVLSLNSIKELVLEDEGSGCGGIGPTISIEYKLYPEQWNQLPDGLTDIFPLMYGYCMTKNKTISQR